MLAHPLMSTDGNPPTPPPIDGDATLPPSPEERRERIEYLKWNCDHLSTHLRGQWERKARIETKVGGLVAVLNVFAGFVLIPRTGTAANATLAGAMLAVRIGALVALSVAIVCWFLAVKVGRIQNMNPQAFTDDDSTPHAADFPHRYERVRRNLLAALAVSIPLVEQRGVWVRRCEGAAVLSYAFLFVLVLLEVLK